MNYDIQKYKCAIHNTESLLINPEKQTVCCLTCVKERAWTDGALIKYPCREIRVFKPFGFVGRLLKGKSIFGWRYTDQIIPRF